MFHSRLNRSDAEVLVAQVCDLPYRRLAAGRVSLRRLASAGCKPAIRQTGGLRYAFGVADAYEMFRLAPLALTVRNSAPRHPDCGKSANSRRYGLRGVTSR